MFIGMCVCSYLAVSADWRYGLAAAAMLAVWLVLGMIDGKRYQRDLSEALSSAFLDEKRPVVDLDRPGHYGWPTVTLVFATEADLQQAMMEGRICAFKQSVQTLLAHTGSTRNPFDAERAVDVVVRRKPKAWQAER